MIFGSCCSTTFCSWNENKSFELQKQLGGWLSLLWAPDTTTVLDKQTAALAAGPVLAFHH